MGKFIADLHLHSKYSRAVSDRMIISEMAKWAGFKGIDLVGTADFTHPLWFRELETGLVETGNGLYRLKDEEGFGPGPNFILSTELSCIYFQSGRNRRIHLVILAPSLITVAKLNQALGHRGAKLLSDGRPILGMNAQELCHLIWEIAEDFVIIPAHAWTPWHGLYGSKSGFDSIEECFGDLAPKITAVETGLSSSPAMNWRIGELEDRAIVSFSDAHSPEKLGREATIFEGNLSYQGISQALESGSINQESKTRIVGTIEFYPEEGKYHYTGHRVCHVCHSPADSAKLGTTCPVCGKPLTVGVMHRVEKLAGEERTLSTKFQIAASGVKWFSDPDKKRPPYVMIVPLLEIIADALSLGSQTRGVMDEYLRLVESFGSEFNVLLKVSLGDLARVAGEKVVEGIRRVRAGELSIEPGFDGVFGKVKIFGDETENRADQWSDQLGLF